MPQTSLSALLLDLDGTLVDSAPDLRTALNHTLSEFDRPEVSLPQVHAMIGDGLAALVERGFRATGPAPSPELLATAVERCDAIYLDACCVESRLYPGVAATLPDLTRRGYRLAVCTNKPVAAARELLRALGVLEPVELVVGGDSVEQRKPHPAPLLHTLATMEVEPGAAIMVGDGPNDALAAHGAGTRFVLARYGYGGETQARLPSPDAIIERFDELPHRLDGLVRSD